MKAYSKPLFKRLKLKGLGGAAAGAGAAGAMVTGFGAGLAGWGFWAHAENEIPAIRDIIRILRNMIEEEFGFLGYIESIIRKFAEESVLIFHLRHCGDRLPENIFGRTHSH
jgi:hypothetical protein